MIKSSGRTYWLFRPFDLTNDIISQMKVVFTTEDGRRDTHNTVGSQKRIREHILDRFAYTMSIHSLEQAEARVIQLVEVVHFLMMPANLIANDS